MTIRSVATACGVGIGTVYNYFQSKEMLVTSFMLEDWMLCIQKISTDVTEAESVNEALYCMYNELLTYKEKYEILFNDENAEADYNAAFMQRHHMLRAQLAEPMKQWTCQQDKVDAEFLAEFIAENMLSLIMAGKSFDLVASVLLQLF